MLRGDNVRLDEGEKAAEAMSIQNCRPPPREAPSRCSPRGSGEARRRILMQIGEQEKRRSVQLSDVARHALPATDKGDAEPTMKRADGLTLSPTKHAAVGCTRPLRAHHPSSDERDGRAEYSPLHPPDPSIVPAPVFTPSIQGWVPRAKQV